MVYAAIAIYVLIGVFRVWLDFRLRFYEQPAYVSEQKWLLVLLFVLTWPILVSSDAYWWYLKRKHRKAKNQKAERKQ